jgi:alpha-L-fucosidase
MRIETGVKTLFIKKALASFHPDTAQAVLLAVAEGTTLTSLKRQGVIKSESDVMLWCKAFDDFREAYIEAIEMGASVLAYQTLDVAEDPTITDGMRMSMIKSRMWIAGKHNETYQDKQTIKNENVNAGLTQQELEAKKEQILKQIQAMTQTLSQE